MIRCEQLQRSFSKNEVLSSVTLQIDEPKIIALVGHNGAGKSTLLRILAGRLKPTKGEVWIDEQNPFQNLQIAERSIFIEDVMEFPQHFKLSQLFYWASQFYPNWQQEIAEKLCDYAGLNLSRYYKHLSKGQAATFRLIYGLCTRCDYTYLDEPMNGMDESIRDDFYKVILKEYIEHPRMMMISTHYLKEVKQLVEDIVILHDGKIKMHASIDELDQYALQISGSDEAVRKVLPADGILHFESKPPYAEAVVEASKLNAELAKQYEIQVRPVDAQVASRYLTAHRQGGIADVYNK